MTEPSGPPVADRRPHRQTHHGQTIDDPYHWLRDPAYPQVTDPDILSYLEAENAWFEAHMKPHRPLVDCLFREMRGRIKEDDSSVPQKDGDWLYWTRFLEGTQYQQWYRRAVSGGPDILLLDENALAEGKEYFRLGAFSVSPDGKRLAYSYDDNGSERFEAHIRDLETGEDLPDTIPGTLSSLVWTADSGALLYGLANEHWRTDNARLHVIGGDVVDDALLYQEEQDGFTVGIGTVQSERFIVIATGDNETSEVRLLPRDDPRAEPILVSARQKGREYEVEEHDGTLFILTNDDHANFRLATAPLDAPGEWTTLIAGSDDFYLTDVTAFRDFYVVEGRERGLDQVEIRRYDNPMDVQRVAFPEASYDAGLGNNPEHAVDRLRLSYQSMVTPATVYDYHVGDARLETLKVQEIPSGYSPDDYVTERLEIRARDGTIVPVSLVRATTTPVDGSAPLHLYAYGAYGYAVPPGFSTSRLSLVDRGFTYAIAHIRGGDDLGREWYLAGKMERRTNSFTDFVDVANGLIERGYTAKGRISASGGSAGGGLMGAVVNSDPDLWGAVVAHVPFVDVLNTMLDGELPLTPGEWPEWGNPITDAAAFAHIRSYSPYDNVAAQDYPPMLVTGGLADPRVTYWEPAKWTAKLRATKTDGNALLLKTNMGAGHGGKSGRWNALEETAEEYAFILWQLGMAEDA